METNDQMMYSANGVRPVFPVHPGEILGEELTARGISGKEFAQMAGMQATHVSAIIHGTRNVTQPVAEKIAKVLDGISAEFWLKMQKEYNIAKNRKTKGVSGSVSGYSQSGTPAVARALAEPESSYGNKCQMLLSVPLSDKALLEQLAGRMDWKIL